jgi:hypothetical protein
MGRARPPIGHPARRRVGRRPRPPRAGHYIPVMERQSGESLQRFVREHHVHYEVEPEAAVEGGKTEVVGFGVRLFATHGEDRLEAPSCPRCVELQDELRAFAERVVVEGGAAGRAEIAPSARALYQSTEVPGADEVSIAVRVRCDLPEHRQGGDAEDRCLGELRERLGALGVPKR